MFEQLLPLNSTLLLSLFPPSLLYLSLSFYLLFFLLSISSSFSFSFSLSPYLSLFLLNFIFVLHKILSLSLFLPFSSFHFFPSIIFCLLLMTDNSDWTKSLDLHLLKSSLLFLILFLITFLLHLPLLLPLPLFFSLLFSSNSI